MSRRVSFTVYPFVAQEGTIRVPDSVPEADVLEYIYEHFEEAKLSDLSEPEYDGCTIEIDE